MSNIYLEVSMHANGVEIYNHTHFIEMFSHIGTARDVIEMNKRFKFHTVEGKQINYHIMGLPTYEQSKQFAIWYHTAKASGIISAYRLD